MSGTRVAWQGLITGAYIPLLGGEEAVSGGRMGCLLSDPGIPGVFSPLSPVAFQMSSEPGAALGK